VILVMWCIVFHVPKSLTENTNWVQRDLVMLHVVPVHDVKFYDWLNKRIRAEQNTFKENGKHYSLPASSKG